MMSCFIEIVHMKSLMAFKGLETVWQAEDLLYALNVICMCSGWVLFVDLEDLRTALFCHFIIVKKI